MEEKKEVKKTKKDVNSKENSSKTIKKENTNKKVQESAKKSAVKESKEKVTENSSAANKTQKENKKPSKVDNRLKIILSILVIVLVTAISFGGIYIQNKGRMSNIIPEYSLGMDLQGSRKLGVIVDDSTNKVIYDKDGNVVTEEGEDTTTKEEPINPEEVLTKENFEKSKEIINKRLQLLNVPDYTIALNEEDGSIMVDMLDYSDTDTVAQYMYLPGKFEVTDPDGNVLLDNSHIEKATVKYGYVSSNSNATTVFLQYNLIKKEQKN